MWIEMREKRGHVFCIFGTARQRLEQQEGRSPTSKLAPHSGNECAVDEQEQSLVNRERSMLASQCKLPIRLEGIDQHAYSTEVNAGAAASDFFRQATQTLRGIAGSG